MVTSEILNLCPTKSHPWSGHSSKKACLQRLNLWDNKNKKIWSATSSESTVLSAINFLQQLMTQQGSCWASESSLLSFVVLLKNPQRNLCWVKDLEWFVPQTRNSRQPFTVLFDASAFEYHGYFSLLSYLIYPSLKLNVRIWGSKE